ncbi:DUF4426 domain-containing protein [Marichromatium bheemlicum]|uniref:DUF4426 domain-containing protein n=1 Tax=Marichromatium bheemlicum TaxID=365339 RepID=A0ABX1I7J0_9GAMM|nr:DUF4426 domain-containing protein [Marichromatium bheemlicum]NKN32984.1 DUF4426 domain-containing protein [Marichromatium bheemlicum]
MFRLRALLLPLGVALSLSAPVGAETTTSADGYHIHYNAIPTATLNPEIASEFDILRSKRRGMLNVGVRGPSEQGMGAPTRARIEVEALTPPSTETTRVPMREITIPERGTVHYVGEFPIEEEQLMVFRIAVTPEGSDQTTEVELEQQFFTED